MFTKIEDFSSELWLEIFTYLNICEQFNALFGLNRRLNQLLFSHRYQISCKDNHENTEYLLKYILPHLTHRHNVSCLRLENTNKIDLAYYGHLFHFPCLTTMTLHRLKITKDFINLFQQNSIHLRYLNISPLVFGENKIMQRLLKIIMSLSNLQTCRIRTGICMSPIPLTISSKSPIKNLHLVAMKEDCFITRLIDLLQYLPYLQSLHVVANHLDFTNTTVAKNTDCTFPIINFTLSVSAFVVPFIEFTNVISTLTPHVQELTIICRTPLQDLTYLNRSDWDIFIDTLPNLKKLTLNCTYTSAVDEQIWNKTCQMLTKLMTRNHICLQIEKSK